MDKSIFFYHKNDNCCNNNIEKGNQEKNPYYEVENNKKMNHV